MKEHVVVKSQKKECPNKVGMTRQNFYGLPFLHLANHTHTSLVPSPSHPSFYLEIKAGVGRTANEATHTPQSPPCMPHHVDSCGCLLCLFASVLD